MTLDPFAPTKTSPDASPMFLDPETKAPKPGQRGYSQDPNPQTFAEARLLKSYWRDPRGGSYYRSKVRWMREYRDFSKWPKQVLMERRERLRMDLATLAQLLEESDEQLQARGWNGAKYFQMWIRSRSWAGQLAGLDEAMMNRREV